MRWFSRGKDNDVWDADIQGPIGDIEAAQKIRAFARPLPTLPRTWAAATARLQTPSDMNRP